MSFSDAQRFDISNYKRVGGKWIANSERVKTGVPFVSQLLPPVIDVLERYNWQVPHLQNGEYNQCLKALGMAAGITTKMHSHLARHTFATWMLRNGVKVENLARMLGHTKLDQTLRYAKVVAQSVHDDFDMIAEKMKK
jgi:integrase